MGINKMRAIDIFFSKKKRKKKGRTYNNVSPIID
jgi:hypothetical protein